MEAKNQQRKLLWKQLKSAFNGNLVAFKAQNYSYGTLNQIKQYLDDVKNITIQPSINEQRKNLWKALKIAYVGRMEAYKAKNYRYGNLQTIQQYIDEIDDEIPLNYYDQLKNVAKALDGIKLNLSKTELFAEIIKEIIKNPISSFNKIAMIKSEVFNTCFDRIKTVIPDKVLLKFIYKEQNQNTDKIITINDDTMRSYTPSIKSKIFQTTDTDNNYSDGWEETNNLNIISMEMEQIVPKTKSRKSNAFFPFINETDIDLTRYGIFDKDDDPDTEPCLVRTLRNVKIDKGVLSDIALSFPECTEGAFPLSKMKDVAKLIGNNIVIHYHDPKIANQKRTLKYNINVNFDTIHIAQYEGHFFNYEDDTAITRAYIENKDYIDEHYSDNDNYQKMNKIIKNKDGTIKACYYDQNNYNPLDSLNLVLLMHKNNLFSPYIKLEHYDKKISNFYRSEPCLDNYQQNQILEKEIEINTDINEDIIMYADCETDVNAEYHELLAFCFKIKGDPKLHMFKNTGNMDDFISKIKNAITKMIEKYNPDKKKKNIMYFHNLKYDAKILEKHLYSSAECVKDGAVYSKTFYVYNKLKIECRDTMKHFGGRLADAQKMFNLNIGKSGGINYSYYNPTKMHDHIIDIDTYQIGVNPKEHHDFDILVKDELYDYDYDKKNNTFNPVKWYMHYLKLDVLTLESAMEKYRELILKITGLDAHNFLTISSIGQSYVISKGCYNNCVKVSSSLRQYIQQAIKGGRVYVPPEHKGKAYGNENEPIADFDGVSLYLSAMHRIDGIPMGKIKRGDENTNYKETTYYIVRIKLTEINKTQSTPMISYHNTDGTIKYTNEINEVKDLILTVDKTTLEDWCEFHKIEYSIVDGIYWDQGYNTKLKAIAQHLHEERCIYKKTNIPLANCLKLIGNSIYGKSGIKKSESKTVFISKDKFHSYVSDHWGLITEIEETPFNYKIMKHEFDTSHNRNYIACSILSQSKRIMQEVFNCFNETNRPVFYTDTDSIHCYKRDIPIIEKCFSEKYNRVINGKDLGQFHNDFTMKGCTDVDSIHHRPVGTKCYIDVLKGIDEITKEVKYDLHLRLKGVSESAMNERIAYEMKKKKCDRIQAGENIYKALSKGLIRKFTMNPTQHNVSMVFDKHGIKNRETGSFVRSVRFPAN